MAKYRDPVDAILGLTQSATKVWTKQRKAEERNASARANRHYRMMKTDRVTIKDAAFEVMEKAYQKASSNGTLPVNPRQIYYAARPEILKVTDANELRSGYFTQSILRAYMDEHDCSHWDIVWDARGHFTEPHTKIVVPLGTLEVRQYLGERPKLGDVIKVDSCHLYPTKGPKHRYSSVLFVEKEGFDPLLQASHIAERFDVGIMSTKGMSVSASRLLLDRLVARGVERVLVLHDFDLSGFSIIGTLGTNSNVYWFRNKIPIIDIGLRLDDVGGLLDEPYRTDKDWGAVSKTLRRHGATPEEIAFLGRGQRVELNAMTSAEFISFIEDKFEEHGVKKLIPDDTILEQHARRVIERRLAEIEIALIRERIVKQASEAPLPDDPRGRVETLLEEQPELPWDAAIAAILNDGGGAP
jgi:hypothetical protein